MHQIYKYEPKTQDYHEGYGGKFGYSRNFLGVVFNGSLNGFSITKYEKKKYDDITKFGEKKAIVHMNVIVRVINIKKSDYITMDSIIVLDEINLMDGIRCLEGFVELKNKKPLQDKLKIGIKYLIGKVNSKERESRFNFGKVYQNNKNEYFHIVSPSFVNKIRNKLIIVKIVFKDRKPEYVGLLTVYKSWISGLKLLKTFKLEETEKIYKFALDRLMKMINLN